MTDLETIKDDMLRTADFAYRRLRNRLAGLTDEEYLWEPAPGCWTIRPAEGGWTRDRSRLPRRPAPLTTIAWRLDHLIDVLAGERNATWIGATPVGTLDHASPAPSAAAAIDRLERAFDLFTGNVRAAEAAGLTKAMGKVAGPYAEDTRAAFVLHELDELIHHGSEIAAMRDVYHALLAADPVVTAVEQGDWAAVEARLAQDPAVRTTGLVADMAGREKWDAVRRLAELGFDVNASHGITALHYAAASGDRYLVELLIKHGADLTTKDAEFEIDPAGWAEFFKHAEVAKYLRDQAGVTSAG
jgi:hypothetical protein